MQNSLKGKKSKDQFSNQSKNRTKICLIFHFYEKEPKNPNNSPTSCQDMVGNIIAHYYKTSVKS